ncbi:MAG: hypothetical protein HY286_09250 [Planctomycetes bacterium]|nr:hypothetical protein [Planctomycetota bacterium]
MSIFAISFDLHKDSPDSQFDMDHFRRSMIATLVNAELDRYPKSIKARPHPILDDDMTLNIVVRELVEWHEWSKMIDEPLWKVFTRLVDRWPGIGVYPGYGQPGAYSYSSEQNAWMELMNEIKNVTPDARIALLKRHILESI